MAAFKMAARDESSDSEEFSSESEAEEGDENQKGASTKKKVHINNKEGLASKLSEVLYDGNWLQRLDITIDTSSLEIPHSTATPANSGSKGTTTVHDDFQREMKFYCQAQVAAKQGLEKLRELDVQTQRPEDYFAEMLKTDAHMQKIREKLASKKKAVENSEKAKKLRKLKQFGKKVQREVLEKRQAEKKKAMNAVEQMKKKSRGKFDKANKEDEQFNVSSDKHMKKERGGSAPGNKMKRKAKDQKYGFGGKKRKLKGNTAESSGDTDSFRPAIHGKAPRNKKPGNKNKRPGKSARKRYTRK